jgi:2-keto-4-pentenoate hydratase/2-oxohepta-3-ene-1,7-dioic acid hydratase in catechol pathway
MRDASELVSDWRGDVLDPDNLAGLADIDISHLPVVEADVRLGPCVGHVGSFVCVGINYLEHANETGSTPPTEPLIFMKSTSAVSGPNDPILIPKGAICTDWEVELGIVIGRTARYVEEARALDHVAGYCTVDDVSERDFQKNRSGQWVKGKSADSFGPIGPWLVTQDEIADVQNLHLWAEVNGERMQDSNTSFMIAGVARLVSYISHFFTLRPGDIISTGTPSGVAMGRTPPNYLKPGDTVVLEVEGLGRQTHQVVSAEI